VGVVRGLLCVNREICDKKIFRKISGYVEQFDSLPSVSTAGEAILFSAALRLKPSEKTGSDNICEEWTHQILEILELTALKDTLIGNALHCIVTHLWCLLCASQ
jgi:ABC-type multidrug transport system ATPase subunit